MPFDESFDEIYQLGIRQSCIDAGAYCERVDEQYFEGTMLDRIYNQISKADVIIADMTGKNPNVFYEVGYAHALGKKTILLTKDQSDIPFDLKHYPHIIYKGKIIKIKEELTKKLEWLLNQKENNIEKYKIDLELYIGTINLSSNNTVLNTTKDEINTTVLNNSYRTYLPGEFRIGVIAQKNIINILNMR